MRARARARVRVRVRACAKPPVLYFERALCNQLPSSHYADGVFDVPCNVAIVRCAAWHGDVPTRGAVWQHNLDSHCHISRYVACAARWNRVDPHQHCNPAHHHSPAHLRSMTKFTRWHVSNVRATTPRACTRQLLPVARLRLGCLPHPHYLTHSRVRVATPTCIRPVLSVARLPTTRAALRTGKVWIRADGSTAHLCVFDPETGRSV